MCVSSQKKPLFRNWTLKAPQKEIEDPKIYILGIILKIIPKYTLKILVSNVEADVERN